MSRTQNRFPLDNVRMAGPNLAFSYSHEPPFLSPQLEAPPVKGKRGRRPSKTTLLHHSLSVLLLSLGPSMRLT